GKPVGPKPVTSTQIVPDSEPVVRVCQTWPTPSPPIVTHASSLLFGLKAMPEIQASPVTCLLRSKVGRLPATFVQVADAPVAFVLIHRAPYWLPLKTVPVAPAGPMTSRSITSVRPAVAVAVEVVLPCRRTCRRARQDTGAAVVLATA